MVIETGLPPLDACVPNGACSNTGAILDSLADVVWSMSASPPRMLCINRAVETLYGRPASEFYAKPDLRLDVVHPDDRARVAALWEQALGGALFDIEYRIVTAKSEQRWVHDRGQPVLGPDGRVARVDGIARDVSLRRDREERTARNLRLRSMMTDVDAAIVRSKHKAELYSDACRIVMQHGGFRLAWIGELDANLDVHIRAIGGDPGHFLRDVRFSAHPDSYKGGGLIGACVATGKPVASNDVASDDRLIRAAENVERGHQSCTLVPLKRAGRVTGVLALYAGERDFFDDDALRLLDELGNTVSFALDCLEKAARLDHLANHDVRTGLPNRNLFLARLGELAAHASAESSRVTVMMIELVRFRSVADAVGLATGEAVLRRVAERLEQAVDNGTCGCFRADEFALALVEPSGQPEGASVLLERVRECLDAPLVVERHGVRIEARAGLAVYPQDGKSAEALLGNAEAALNSARKSGARFVFYAPEMNARAGELLARENRLRTALRNEELVLYYQPRVSLTTGQVCGLEGLMRWVTQDGRVMPPADFVPLLEETGLILDAGPWALTRAARDAAGWQALGVTPPPISVNVSAVELGQIDFVERVISAIAAGGTPDLIEIELTESMVMADVEANARKLEDIRAAGIRIAIDDFGTGYSSLSSLARLPVDTLKIDRSFVLSMMTSPLHMTIVTTIISMAHSLNLRTVAEGVETREHAHLLGLLHCEEAQGYFYTQPVPPAEVPSMLARLRANWMPRARAVLLSDFRYGGR